MCELMLSNSRTSELLPSTRSLLRHCLALALFSVFFVGSLIAQGYGKISGTVTDATGAVVPDAVVTAIQAGTQARTEVKTNRVGEYIFPSLAPSVYDLSVAAGGFSGYLQQNVLLQADGAVTVNATLKPGDTSQTVTVTTAAV